jgi:hypothetical protein
MNKYDALTRSQILIAIHENETRLARLSRNSKAYTRLHTACLQLAAALERKNAAQLKKWHDAPTNRV